MRVALSIKDRESWIELFERFKAAGFMKEISEEDVDLEEDQFPLEFFIDADPIFDLIGNPIVKPFKKKLDIALTHKIEEEFT